MDRKEFFVNLGKGAALVALTVCFGNCGVNSNNNPTYPSAPQNVDFTLDLTDQANASLNSVGGYIYQNGIIIARVDANTYDAVSKACTHQGYTIAYQSGNKEFHCSAHGSNFDVNGKVVNGPASIALVKYNTQLNGNKLRIFS